MSHGILAVCCATSLWRVPRNTSCVTPTAGLPADFALLVAPTGALRRLPGGKLSGVVKKNTFFTTVLNFLTAAQKNHTFS